MSAFFEAFIISEEHIVIKFVDKEVEHEWLTKIFCSRAKFVVKLKQLYWSNSSAIMQPRRNGSQGVCDSEHTTAELNFKQPAY